MRLAAFDLARPVAPEAARTVLTRVAASALPIMVFVGNPGCVQIHSGPVHRIEVMGPWLNVLDPAFNLHLREDRIVGAYVVRKPSVNGEIHSLELYDAGGDCFCQVFGQRHAGGTRAAGLARAGHGTAGPAGSLKQLRARAACQPPAARLPSCAGGDALTELPRLIDPFARAITYLRVSVTDRCDFRCVYCMSEHMEFLPKAELLTLEELDRLCSAFVGLGRREAADHRRRAPGAQGHHDLLPRHVAPPRHRRAQGADADHQRQPAAPLRRRARRLRRAAGQRLARHARPGEVRSASPAGAGFAQVLDGIDAAVEAGLRVKINTVALKGVNDDEIHDLVAWCGDARASTSPSSR